MHQGIHPAARRTRSPGSELLKRPQLLVVELRLKETEPTPRCMPSGGPGRAVAMVYIFLSRISLLWACASATAVDAPLAHPTPCCPLCSKSEASLTAVPKRSRRLLPSSGWCRELSAAGEIFTRSIDRSCVFSFVCGVFLKHVNLVITASLQRIRLKINQCAF